MSKIDAKLGNADFIKRAPEEVVEEQRERREEALARKAKMEEALKRLVRHVMRLRAARESRQRSVKSISNLTFNATMMAAIMPATIDSHMGATSGPILAFDPVNSTRGTTAKGSCRLKIT